LYNTVNTVKFTETSSVSILAYSSFTHKHIYRKALVSGFAPSTKKSFPRHCQWGTGNIIHRTCPWRTWQNVYSKNWKMNPAKT